MIDEFCDGLLKEVFERHCGSVHIKKVWEKTMLIILLHFSTLFQVINKNINVFIDQNHETQLTSMSMYRNLTYYFLPLFLKFPKFIKYVTPTVTHL